MSKTEFSYTVAKYRVRNKYAQQKILDHQLYLVPQESVKKKLIEELERCCDYIGKRVRVNNLGSIETGTIIDVAIDCNFQHPQKYKLTMTTKFDKNILNLTLNKKVKCINDTLTIEN